MTYEVKSELELIKINEEMINNYKVPYYTNELIKYED
jgi:hypothetical protein